MQKLFILFITINLSIFSTSASDDPHSFYNARDICLNIPIKSSTNSLQILPIKESLSIILPSTFSEFVHIFGIHEPITFRNAANDWENASLNLKKLASDYGHLSIEVFPKNSQFSNETINMSLLEFINDLLYNTAQAGSAKSYGKTFWKNYAKLLLDAKFPNPECKAHEYEFFLLPKGTVTGLHNHKATFLALFYGAKVVTLIDPKFKDSIYCVTSYINDPLKCSSNINVIDPDFERYPDFKNIQMFQTILYPGDVLFIPKHWFHHVISLENSISISFFISDRISKLCKDFSGHH